MAQKQPEKDTTKKQDPSRWQKFVAKSGRIVAGTSIPEVLVVITLCLSRYLQNSDFSYPSEIIISIVLLGILSSAAYYIFRIILRDRLGAHLAALPLTYGLYAFSYAYKPLQSLANSLIPDSATSFTAALLKLIIWAVVFGLLGFALQRLFKLKQLRQLPTLKFLVFVICFIFAAQVGKVGLRLWEIKADLAYKLPESSLLQAPATTAAATEKPNVYYLLFDRYANAETLKNTYQYDNQPFLNNLKQQGLTVREEAYANYPFTTQSVSSTLSVDYHDELGKQFKNDAKDFQTAFPYRKFLDNSPVTQAFQASGYQYNQVSSWWDFTRINPSADTNPSKSFRLRILGKNYWLTDLQRDIVNKSILSPLLLKGLTIGNATIVQYQLDRNPAQNFHSQINAVEAIAANSNKQSTPQFTFAHILSPHDPYVFDADGNTPNYDGNRTDNGADEYVKYTNQLTYVNSQLTELIATIRSSDPSAVIVLQTDEGPYPKQFRGKLSASHYYDPINLDLEGQRQKFGILAAYYLPGVEQQVAATAIDSSVNAFRYVLNQYLGYNLEMLPDCQFTSGNKYTLYSYQLVTGKLKGTDNPAACQQYQ